MIVREVDVESHFRSHFAATRTAQSADLSLIQQRFLSSPFLTFPRLITLGQVFFADGSLVTRMEKMEKGVACDAILSLAQVPWSSLLIANRAQVRGIDHGGRRREGGRRGRCLIGFLLFSTLVNPQRWTTYACMYTGLKRLFRGLMNNMIVTEHVEL